MRLKLGLILKLCILLTVALLSLVLLRESGTSTTTVGEYSTLSQKRQLKNDSKSFLTNSKITQTEKSSETSDLAEASDSLAGKRIDGLPNITETRFLKLIYLDELFMLDIIKHLLLYESSDSNNYRTPH